GHRTADQEHGQGKDQVEGADFLVVGGEQPARQAGRVVAVVFVLIQCGFMAHDLVSLLLFTLPPDSTLPAGSPVAATCCADAGLSAAAACSALRFSIHSR